MALAKVVFESFTADWNALTALTSSTMVRILLANTRMRATMVSARMALRPMKMSKEARQSTFHIKVKIERALTSSRRQHHAVIERQI